MINKNTMNLISNILLLLVIIGLILYFYFKNKDTFTIAQDAGVGITYTVEVDETNGTPNGYKFKDSSDNYLIDGDGIDLNPTLTLEDGKTYEFNNTVNNETHPFSLKSFNDPVGINDNNGTIILTATESETPYTYVFNNDTDTDITGIMNVITSSATTTTGAATTTTGAATTPPPAPTPPPIVEIPTEPAITFPEHMTKDQYLIILGLQEKINNTVNSITTGFSNFLDTLINYDPNTTEPTVEPFVDTITLNSDAFPELKSYAEIYNKNVALLDDPNELKSKTFDAYIYMQNNKINKMKDELKLLQETIQNNKKEIPAIKSFKSMNNSQSFNVELYNNKNPNNSNKYPNYLVYGNNGCLEYENNINDGAKWNFKSCDANNKNQQFVSTKIDNIDTYNSFINSETNKDRILKDNTSTLFGFNVINPIDAQDQCLQLNTDGLSVMPCSLDFSQRFRESYSTVMP